jgi:hypothetical protein
MTVVAVINQGQRQEVRVNLNEARGIVDVRAFDRISVSGNLYTVTKLGIPIAAADLDAVIAGLIEARNEVERMGLLGGGAA